MEDPPCQLLCRGPKVWHPPKDVKQVVWTLVTPALLNVPVTVAGRAPSLLCCGGAGSLMWAKHWTICSGITISQACSQGREELLLIRTPRPKHTLSPSQRISSSFLLFLQRNTLSLFPLCNSYNIPLMSLCIYKRQEETMTSAPSVFCPGKFPKAIKE